MSYQLDEYRYRGLGGWLVLVAIGLFVTPIKIGVLLMGTLVPALQGDTWASLTTPGGEAYHPFWGPLLIMEFAGNAIFLFGALGLLVLFFTKSRHFPLAIIVFFLANLVFVPADFFLADLIPAVAKQADSSSLRELVRTTVSCLIWVPYFLVSKRVKATFVEPRGPLTPPPFAPE
jgi:hypothetical protein